MAKSVRAFVALLFVFGLAASTHTAGYAGWSAPSSTAPGTSFQVTVPWVVAGNFQSEVSSCNDWDNACAETTMEDSNGDGVFRLLTGLLPSGSYEYKIFESGSWDNGHPAVNVPFASSGGGVRWYFQPGPNRLSDSANQCVASVAGNFQSELGSPGDWMPSDLRTMMWQESTGSDWYGLTAMLPAGSFEYKVTRDEAWAESYPASNVVLNLAAATEVTFRYNCTTHEVQDSINNVAEAGHDNNIWWSDLGHDSRDTLFRTPGGSVETGTPVTLRLRAADGDLTGARVRLWNDRSDVQMMLEMTLAAADGTYEWWEATVPASAEPTIYWYRFIAIDGTATAYYEDDTARNGGWGETLGASADRSWQLTVYDPSFQTPDWVKNGIMYQLFVDRFRDGNSANNTPEGSFFYGANSTIERSGNSDWNTVVCDPRDDLGSSCLNQYSDNFYGGDLDGLIDQLDYLDDLGVTVLYLNPIFESPSNHKYDTTDFSVVDDNFGGDAAFQALVAAADARGMRIVLDGVFNHTSSDSIYFDRYGRYPDYVGACESAASPFRDWYYFQAAAPVGTGPCAGDTTYTSWFGYDSLPKLNSGNQNVRDLIYSGGPEAIGPYWMTQGADGWRLDVGGDVDPGVTHDPGNDFWEGFRDAVHAAKPDAYIVGEEWNFATPWTLGEEWDATMNYQTSSAILSFWRDEPFSDNDHNTNSSAGVLAPLTPSQLDARLLNIAERYPPEALYAMMNLLGSHDTNRPLFMLDHNADLNDSTIYENPAYDWSDAITRLKGVALLQMTLPGSPTIYYGDEVGLVGPVAWDGSQWQDDPYNRQPFPWLDQTGTPFYTHLQSTAGQNQLRDHYTLLTSTRNSHAALRTGSFDTLLVDDTADVYGYGRRMADHSDAAVVLANRGGSAQSVTVDVDGYLPYGTVLVDVLGGMPYVVDPSGSLNVTVPARAGALLVTQASFAAAPVEVTDLAAAAGANVVTLNWSAAGGATEYDVYRSLVSGGGYSFVATTSDTTYTDSGLENAVTYHYVVVARDGVSGLESGYSNEASATPQHDLSTAWFNLQWPPTISHTISTSTPTENIYGQLWIDGATGQNGPADGIWAQVGYGPQDHLPTSQSWQWNDMAYLGAVGNNDEYVGNLLPDRTGTFHYTTRWSSDGGQSWFYTDLGGPGYSSAEAGVLTVNPSGDTTAPDPLINLTVDGTTTGSISLSWEASGATDLAGYELYRENVAATGYSRIASLDSSTTSYVDTSVTTNQTYNYHVVAYDTSFNRSDPSNIVQATAEARMVDVTFSVTVPDFTEGTIYIVGSVPEVGSWDPGAVAMTQVAGRNSSVTSSTWSITLSLLDGTSMEYKYTRGNWETVEKELDGNAEIINRPLTVDYASGSAQTVNDAVANWRDPLAVSTSPVDGATEVPVDTTINIQWNQAMRPETAFTVSGPGGPVAGTISHDDATDTTTFTPSSDLAASTIYTVQAAGQVDAAGDVQQATEQFSFTTAAPLAVQLAAFTASVVGVDEVRLDWETLSETGNVGFNVYRATTEASAGTLLTSQMIPSQAPGSAQGFAYEWTDENVAEGQYYYWLEAIDAEGEPTRFGPAGVMVGAPTALTIGTMQSGAASPSPWLMGGVALGALAGVLAFSRSRRR